MRVLPHSKANTVMFFLIGSAKYIKVSNFKETHSRAVTGTIANGTKLIKNMIPLEEL